MKRHFASAAPDHAARPGALGKACRKVGPALALALLAMALSGAVAPAARAFDGASPCLFDNDCAQRLSGGRFSSAPRPPWSGATAIPSAASDAFAMGAMSDDEMRAAAGGESVAFDISRLGVNITQNEGSVTNVSANGSTTGAIAQNTVSSNSGVTTVLNNTGNGVIFQNTVQVNIFLNEAAND